MAWSGAVMKERRILGTLFVCRGAALGLGFAPPAWKDAAISLKPVACGFTGGGGGSSV